MIALWRFDFKDRLTYDLMIPINHVSNISSDGNVETELRDEENEIFERN